MELRALRLDEVVRYDEVRLETWRAAYRGLVPDAFLDGLAVTAQLTASRTAMAQDPHRALHVAVVDGVVVGIAAAGPPRDDDLDPDDVTELGALYVLPDHWGGGIGRALLSAVLARRPRPRQALWVLEANDRSRAFYASCGFAPDGHRKVETLASRSPRCG
ncbi:MAG: GNAT family N-acetyltransferase [Mycobacteriales bacterium]|nr:GNAT family N-acetyltransferase [Mycobacteriales bacterium]